MIDLSSNDPSDEQPDPDSLSNPLSNQHIYKNLLLIDSRVKAYDEIIASINNDTAHIVFDYDVDTTDTLKTKITALSMDVIVAVGIVQHNYVSPNYQWLSSMQPALLQDIETMDPSLNTWTDVKDFCSFLKNDKGTLFYDLLACNTYSDPNWVYALDQLETACDMEFRASSDTTGWGGNWILESDNVDLTTIYFTPLILQWQYTLGTIISSNTFINQTFITTTTTTTGWPVTINAGFTITFTENITLDLATQYFIIGGDNVTINGGGFLVTLNNITGWNGLVENGTSTAPGKTNSTIKYIGITTSGAGTMTDYCAYLCRQYYSKGISPNSTINYVTGCYNTGSIANMYGGGLIGSYSGSPYTSLLVTNCYNTGSIANSYGGGLFASNICKSSPHTTSVTNCYSYHTGGGYDGTLFGILTGTSSYPVKINNCISISSRSPAFFTNGTGSFYTSTNSVLFNYTPWVSMGNLTGREDGASNIWLNLNKPYSNSQYYLLTYNCNAELIRRFGSITAASTAFFNIYGYNAVAVKPTITNLSTLTITTSTITFTPATCNKNVITNYKYQTSNDNATWSAGTLFYPALTSTSTTATIPTTSIYIRILAVDVVDGPVSDAIPLANILVNNIYYKCTISDRTASIVNYVAGITSVIIPSSVSIAGVSYSVTSIIPSVFMNDTIFTSVTFKTTGLSTIPASLFLGCTALRTLTLPTSGLTSIDTSACSGCISLGSITFPSSLITIGISAFQNCTRLSIVIFSPNNVLTSIGANAFNNCSMLNSVTFPSSLITIGISAFQNCTRLSSVIFSPNNVLTSIGANAFSGCIALTDINFTNITTYSYSAGWSVDNNAFTSSLKNVVFDTILPTANTAITTFTNAAPATATAYKPSGVWLSGNLASNFASVKDIFNSAPTNVAATSTTYSSASVTFTPVSAQPPITNYKYSVDGGNTWTLCSPAITTGPFTISGLSSGTTYSVSIKAINFIGDGPASAASTFTTTNSTIGPFSTIGTNSFLGINNIPNLSVNTNCLAFHAPMGVYFTNPNLYAPTAAYFNFNSNKGFNFKAGTTLLVTIDTLGTLSTNAQNFITNSGITLTNVNTGVWCNGLSVIGGSNGGGGGNIICESNMIVLGKVSCSKLQLSNSSTIVSIRCIDFYVGACYGTSGLKTQNVVRYDVPYIYSTNLFFTITFDNNAGTSGTGYNYTFSSTIVSVTTTTMTFNVQRTDSNAAWSNNLIAHIIITETA